MQKRVFGLSRAAVWVAETCFRHYHRNPAYAAGKFMSDRTVASVWAAEGCAFTSACETHARFNVPGAGNSMGSKPGSVTFGANAGVGSVTATEGAGTATASLVGGKFGCQLHVDGQQVRPPPAEPMAQPQLASCGGRLVNSA